MVSFKKADIIIFDLKMFPLVNFPWEKIKNILHTQEIIEKRCFLLIKSFPKVDPFINIEETSGLDKKLKTIFNPAKLKSNVLDIFNITSYIGSDC